LCNNSEESIIMKKSLFFLFNLLVAATSTRAQTMLRSEIIGRPTSSSITVNAFYAETVEASVEYGTDAQNLSNSTGIQTFQSGEPSEIVVSGLQPNTRYFYRLKARIPGGNFVSRPVRNFHTQRPAGNRFRFIVQADPHLDEQSDTNVYSRCLQNQLEDSADFMIDLGDFLMTDK